VRVLAADLGRALGPGAHLTALRRLASGPFDLDGALPLEALLALIAAGGPLPLISCADALGHLPAVRVTSAVARALRFGQRVEWAALGCETPPAGSLRVLDETAGGLVAVLAAGAGAEVQTLRVFFREERGSEGGIPSKISASGVD
jgi:tRNA pseudouridine55 synthase